MQLGSLRQLTLVIFAIALIPLCALLWQSQKDLATVATMTATDNTFFVGIVGASRNLESDAVDIERLIRQNYIVKNDTLTTLIQQRLLEFEQALIKLCSNLQDSAVCAKLYRRVQRLANFNEIDQQPDLDAQLIEFRSYINELRVSVSTVINARIESQQDTMQVLKQEQAWSTAVLAFVSLILIVSGSHIIVRPFKRLSRLIRHIAQQSSTLPPISQRGLRELIAIEHDLHWLAERLEQLEHLRTALLRHASHELKTPLASIKEGCSLLNEQMVGQLTPAQQEVVALLVNSTDRLNTLVEQLLDYNLLLQQAQPNIIDVEASPLVQQCLTENALVLNQNGHQTKVDITVSHMAVDGDLFRRILDNLLSNAVAHGTRGEPIYIAIYQSNQHTVLDVANHGKPIPAVDRSEIFEPFTRGNQQRNDLVIGAGLGLSIVADCARLMHGSVDIVDVDYADVCFRVSIPLNSSERKA